MTRKTDAGADYTDVATSNIRSVFRGPKRRSLGWGIIQVRLAGYGPKR